MGPLMFTRVLAQPLAGGGMFLPATPADGKLWRLKYRLEGPEKLLAIVTWLNDHIIAQLCWCRGRPPDHVRTQSTPPTEHRPPQPRQSRRPSSIAIVPRICHPASTTPRIVPEIFDTPRRRRR